MTNREPSAPSLARRGSYPSLRVKIVKRGNSFVDEPDGRILMQQRCPCGRDCLGPIGGIGRLEVSVPPRDVRHTTGRWRHWRARDQRARRSLYPQA